MSQPPTPITNPNDFGNLRLLVERADCMIDTARGMVREVPLRHYEILAHVRDTINVCKQVISEINKHLYELPVKEYALEKFIDFVNRMELVLDGQ